jgi:hypothetical protein
VLTSFIKINGNLVWDGALVARPTGSYGFGGKWVWLM